LRIIDWDGGRKNGVEPGTGAQLEMNIACHITSIIVSSNHPPKGRISIFYDSIVKLLLLADPAGGEGAR
jgi:hypothetical protein